MRRALAVAVVSTAVFPLAAVARPDHTGARATASRAAGTVFGGVTSQDYPVVIETSKSGKKVTRAVIAIRMTCTSGAAFTIHDGYARMSVSKKRKFGSAFGPETVRNDDGTTTDFEGSISGKFNKARTKVSGTWSFKGTEHDAAGAVTDTCDSQQVTWRAKQ